MVYNHCFQFPREKKRWNVTLHLMLTGKLKKASFLKMAKSTEKLMISGNESNKEFKRNIASLRIKDGAYYCYCAYVLRISRYSDLQSPMLTNRGIFLRGLKLSGESRP